MGQETIFALSSAPGKAGVAVIRISGAMAGTALQAVSGPLPSPRTATLRTLRNPATGDAIDRGLVLWFPETRSFTGEPTAEVQVHGGRAVVAAVLGALGGLPGLRPAAAGEFTRRAFENGRLDLAQVEALDDLIAADTEMQRRQALRGLEGRLGALVSGWREQLLAIRALLAAEIDFADEGDVGDSAAAGIDSLLLRIHREMAEVLAARHSGRIVSDGFRVVIIGRPNSGKSTLLNRLSGSDAAIVTDIPGTTRDILEVRLDWDGYEIMLSDTAGLRGTTDPVEAIGVARTRDRAVEADLCLIVDERGDWSVQEEFDSLPDSIRIRTKMDVNRGELVRDGDGLSVSALTGDGLDDLRQAVLAKVRALAPAESGLLIRGRQVKSLEAASAAVARALASSAADVEFRDHDVRAAVTALDILVGRIGVEEVLGAVFSRFCVGK